jgi:single-strand DNA-binding protein
VGSDGTPTDSSPTDLFQEREMANYNKVLLMGNLTRDVELKQIAGNQSVAEIGLAVNRRFKDRDGNPREETTFVDCEAWGRTAEVMSQYLSKGKPVFIEGRLKLDTWQDQSGNKRSKMRVVVENFQFVEPRGDGGSSRPSRPAEVAAPSHADDDIPF